VDVVFVPSNKEMYPGNSKTAREDARPTGLNTYVVEGNLSKVMEGASRPTHFRGVTTIVAKLFNVVLPDVAVFGAKDWQQATIIKRMTADLNFPVCTIVAPTLRERDGLAMSSRNKYLVGDLRRQATVLWCAIQMARATVKKLKTFPASKLKAAVKKLVECEPDTRLDYVEFFESDTLSPVSKVKHGTHMALAVFVGKTRLIDNARL
jgi:pantoate--beta-alanine ligase